MSQMIFSQLPYLIHKIYLIIYSRDFYYPARIFSMTSIS